MSIILFLLGALLGAGLMYYLDPRMGNRRRALLRDKFVKMGNKTSDSMESLARDTANKGRGAVAETARQVLPEDVPDEILKERIRSEMGRYVSHPHAIEVTVNDGAVTLSGHILTKEVQPFVAQVKSMPNVETVDNQLEVHQKPDNVPQLQGGVTRPEFR
ncbi:MAG: BON domain-containing protein [Chloroflexi bacterium]|nr:BON domain-containing protein [Chloroflexota bacterium]